MSKAVKTNKRTNQQQIAEHKARQRLTEAAWRADRVARTMRELQSQLREMVEAGDITATQANEWVNMKADQWALGLS